MSEVEKEQEEVTSEEEVVEEEIIEEEVVEVVAEETPVEVADNKTVAKVPFKERVSEVASTAKYAVSDSYVKHPKVWKTVGLCALVGTCAFLGARAGSDD